MNAWPEVPRLGRVASRLEASLARGGSEPAIAALLDWAPGIGLEVGPPEVLDRAAGLGRPGMIARLVWPRLGLRVGLGLEVPTAHALVDHLLGFERGPGEERLQVTPVERGVVSFALARTLGRLAERPGPLGEWDLLLDRVGPEPFGAEDLGRLITVRWPVRLADKSAGSVRLWLPASLATQWLLARPARFPAPVATELADRLGHLAGEWHAEAGTIRVRVGGLARLRPGQVLVPEGSPLRGDPLAPTGPIALTLHDLGDRFVLPADLEPTLSGSVVVVQPPVRRELRPEPRESPALSQPSDPPENLAALGEIPATLVVELGRVNLPIGRLADLKPGDVVELARDPAEPIDLTCNGRLVARGELVRVDEDLGIRITSVYL